MKKRPKIGRRHAPYVIQRAVNCVVGLHGKGNINYFSAIFITGALCYKQISV